MASAFNPVTNDYRNSVNTPDFPAPWIINQVEADALFAAGLPSKYRKVVANIATEMTQAEKDAVDAALLSTQRDQTAAELDIIESFARALTQIVMDEFNNHSTKMKEMLDAVDAATSLADLKTRFGLITDPPQRTLAQLKTALRNKLGT